MGYHCAVCNERFYKMSQLLQHKRSHNHWRSHECDVCGKKFQRKDNLLRHKEKHLNIGHHHCKTCGKTFSREDSLQRHVQSRHVSQTGGAIKRPTADNVEGPPAKRILTSKDDPHSYYKLTKVKDVYMAKFRTTASSYKIQFQDLEVMGITDILKTLKELFQSIIQEVTIESKSTDLVRMVVQCPELDFPITLPFMRREALTAERFLSEIERVLQSYEEFVLDSTLEMEITTVDLPEGGVGKNCKYVDLDKFLLEKRCIIRIQNEDDLCCARAIVAAKAKIDKHGKWNSIRQGRGIQKKLAEELHETAGVPLVKCGIEEIKLFQAVLTEYQINVVSKDHFNAIIYSGPEQEKKIFLYHHDGHYDVITSMPGFVGRSYYCYTCQRGYSNEEEHKCNNVCTSCRKIHSVTEEDWIYCEICNRYFRGTVCFQLHKKTTSMGKSTCGLYYRCKECNVTVNKRLHKKVHVCGEMYCETCKDYLSPDHQCYMQTVVHKDANEVNPTESSHWIFFDFECTQDTVVQCERGFERGINGKCVNCCKATCGSTEHKPNLCVVHKVCSSCITNEVTEVSECTSCGKNERVFCGPNTTETFCKWLFSEENVEATVLCHNFSGYDSYPILNYLYESGIVPKVVPNGAKIMSLEVPHVKLRMIDSLNFLPMALSKLPEMFGFKELAKGYFPHLFNTTDNQNVVLNHLPDASYYNPGGMKPDDRSKFMEWYDLHKHDWFDFQDEILKYCRSDVDILRRCCLKFRDLFMSVTEGPNNAGIDPFEKCMTIASACNLVFRSKFLEENTIGIIPAHGYKPQEKHSLKAIQWLMHLSHVSGRHIQHARNGGEKKIGPYKVDGFSENENGEKIVYEFHGDFWHGNPRAYSRHTVNPVNGFTMEELFQKTLDKKKYLENEGYTYISTWEMDFDREITENQDMRNFVENLEMVSPLEPRDAFYGGRTEAFQMFKEAKDGESIDYYDVTSLYPFINKTGKVPLGHPIIITEQFGDIEQYEGLIKCKIVPPRKLYVPVLPCKIDNKLLFALCKQCSVLKERSVCQHSDTERAFVGTWVIDEVKKALEKGYRIEKIYEVWHFERIEQYDPNTKSGGVFTEYVNTFLKLKQEASGWPKWCISEKDKQKYIDDYFAREGIQLDYDKIAFNPGLRALAKLMLNSFWGKFGQRSNMSQVEHVTNPNVYFDMLTSDRQEVIAVNYVSDDMVEMRWKNKSDFIETSCKTNVIIAAYTTTQARLKLYGYLDSLGTRAMYVDTDSVVFWTRDGEEKLQLGDFLGDLTDEVPNNKIKTFVTGGPKNYAYKLDKTDKKGVSTVCKIRGITLNSKTQNLINYDSVKMMVENFTDKTRDKKDVLTVTDDYNIVRDSKRHKLLTVTQNKDYKIVFDKRRIVDNFLTLPWGY